MAMILLAARPSRSAALYVCVCSSYRLSLQLVCIYLGTQVLQVLQVPGRSSDLASARGAHVYCAHAAATRACVAALRTMSWLSVGT
eukprot:COSAG03_NODE_1709_length_3620_cov_1.569440_2_plen_86_part_00